MSRFTGPLVIEEVLPGRRWRLREPIRYEAGREGSGLMIVVPEGFETDGATIPPVLKPILAVWGSYGRAACLHDYLYWLMREQVEPAMADTFWPQGLRHQFQRRAYIDREFYIAMIACGTRPTLAWLIWGAVRLFGGRYCKPVRVAGV